MKFSSEQKELLGMIYNLSQRAEAQPKPISFESIISDLSPSDCFVNFARKIGGFRIFIYNNDYKDEKQVDIINGKILTYLFLIDLLVKNNLVIIYKLKEPLDYENIFVDDNNKKGFEHRPKSGEFITKSLYSPTFWEIIEKYGSTVIQPSYSLIKLIDNDFKTDDELSTEIGLRKATNGLRLSAIAIFISLLAFIFSIIVGVKSLQTNKRMEEISIENLEIEKEGIDYSRKSSTELKQDKIIEKLDSVTVLLKENNERFISEDKEYKKPKPLTRAHK